MPDRDKSKPTQKHRLVVEAELPSFYADDLVELLAEHGVGDDNESGYDATKPTHALLAEIGEVYSGLLTVEVSGEKDSSIERDVPILFRRAWVETEPPSGVSGHSLIEREQERRAAADAALAEAKAEKRALLDWLRERLPDEWQEATRAAHGAGADAYDRAWAKHYPGDAGRDAPTGEQP